MLPRRVFETLSSASVRDPAVRGLVDHVLRQRADARTSGVDPATPGEFRCDLINLLRGLEEQARTGRLPPYVPPGADVTAMARMVRVRLEVRGGPAVHSGGDGLVRQAGANLYRLRRTAPRTARRRGRGRWSPRSTGGWLRWPTLAWASRGWYVPKLTGCARRRWPG